MSSRSPRLWMWIQLLIGWVPVWALYSTMILTAHAGSSVHSAVFAGVRATVGAALLGLIVHRLTHRVPWPDRVRVSFASTHIAAAVLYSVSWVAFTVSLEVALGSLHGGRLQFNTGAPIGPFLLLGGWMYAMVAGVSYAMQSSQRAAKAESLAVQSQLATMRAQLNPHFLFNALHTVVQLIPLDPARASEAAEKLAVLLRSGLEEQRDLVPLGEEWRFVTRYVELEQMRFGERLAVEMHCDVSVTDALVPSFAVQTLLENAVQHGAAPRAEATRITANAQRVGDRVVIVVADDGSGASTAAMQRGTGLQRLRDRLRALFGAQGTLQIETSPGAGFRATLSMPVLYEHD